MKAVIMAGGKGSRLRPLTCNKPKPLVPILNKPVMEYAIELLKKHGITQIAVTLQYLPESIKDYFGDGSNWGVELNYFEETIPLGTAGSVKNAEDFLDETFVVISGDGLTDIDLSKAIDYHLQRASMATIVLTRVEAPLEYGVVITNEDGKIVRFLEKPSWGEVFSDTVNTGIYVLEPNIFDYVPKETSFDFSKDLFPLLLQDERPLFGYIARGYWCDIGNLSQYRQTQFDLLDGLVKAEIKGTEVAPGIWLGDNVDFSWEAVEGPLYIADNCKIDFGADLREYTVLGENNIVKPHVSIKRSVLWHGNYLDQEAELRGTTVCNNCTIKANSSLFEGSVIGDNCIVEPKGIIRPNVKLWPNKHVEENCVVHTSLIWGDKICKSLFGQLGIMGIANVEITPDFASKVALAYGSVLKEGSLVVIGGESHPFAQMLKRACISGLMSAGINTIDIGASVSPVTRFGVKDLGAQGGIHVRWSATNQDRVIMEFYDYHGINIDKGLERKIENAYIQEDFRKVQANGIGFNRCMPQFSQSYVEQLLATVDVEAIRRRKLRLVAMYDYSSVGKFLPIILKRLGCQVMAISSEAEAEINLPELVLQYHADFGVAIDGNGEKILLSCADGMQVHDDLLTAIMVMICLQTKQPRVLALPVTAPAIMEKIAQKLEGQIIRTRANPRALMESTADDQFQLLFDGFYNLITILDFMVKENHQLTDLVKMIPDFHMEQELVPCSWAEKGKVMRKLIQDTMQEQVELLDGIKVHKDQGWILILPDSDEPVFKIFSEANSEQSAKELAASFAMKIKSYKEEVN